VLDKYLQSVYWNWVCHLTVWRSTPSINVHIKPQEYARNWLLLLSFGHWSWICHWILALKKIRKCLVEKQVKSGPKRVLQKQWCVRSSVQNNYWCQAFLVLIFIPKDAVFDELSESEMKFLGRSISVGVRGILLSEYSSGLAWMTKLYWFFRIEIDIAKTTRIMDFVENISLYLLRRPRAL